MFGDGFSEGRWDTKAIPIMNELVQMAPLSDDSTECPRHGDKGALCADIFGDPRFIAGANPGAKALHIAGRRWVGPAMRPLGM